MTPTERTERRLAVALSRGDRVAAVMLAQSAYAAGDLRRTAVVAMVAGPNDSEPAAAIAASIAGRSEYAYAAATASGAVVTYARDAADNLRPVDYDGSAVAWPAGAGRENGGRS